MKAIHLRLAATAIAGVVMGLGAGQFTVADAQPDYVRYADQRIDPLANIASAPPPRDTVDSGLYPVSYDPVSQDCPDCSDYELGRRWAERAGVTSTAECEAYSWSYERGCLAWLRRNRGA